MGIIAMNRHGLGPIRDSPRLTSITPAWHPTAVRAPCCVTLNPCYLVTLNFLIYSYGFHYGLELLRLICIPELSLLH